MSDRDTNTQKEKQEKGTVVMFKNPVIEWLSRTQVAIPISIFFG